VLAHRWVDAARRIRSGALFRVPRTAGVLGGKPFSVGAFSPHDQGGHLSICACTLSCSNRRPAPGLLSPGSSPGLTTMMCGAVGALAAGGCRSDGTAHAAFAGTILTVAGLATGAGIVRSAVLSCSSTLAMAMLFLLCGPIAAGRGETADRLPIVAMIRRCQPVVRACVISRWPTAAIRAFWQAGLLQASEPLRVQAIWSVMPSSAGAYAHRAGCLWSVRNSSAPVPLTGQGPQRRLSSLLAIAQALVPNQSNPS
jgi:hypothetical protein